MTFIDKRTLISFKNTALCKCDKCRDGYSIVKPVRDNFFPGCTNYKKDGTGCKDSISKPQFYTTMHLSPDVELPVTKPKTHLEENKATKYTEPTQNPADVKTVLSDAQTNSHSIMFKGADLQATILTILACLENVSRGYYYGVTVLVDVLRGSESKRIQGAKFNIIKEYGALTRVECSDV